MLADVSTYNLVAYVLAAVAIVMSGISVFKRVKLRVILPEAKAKTTLVNILSELEKLADETFDLNYDANKEAIEEIQDRVVQLLHILFMMDGKITPEEQAILDSMDIRKLKELLVEKLKLHIK